MLELISYLHREDMVGLHIPRSSLVLDIGSGDRPHPRADVLCDLFIDEHWEQRDGRHIRFDDRFVVHADIQDLPFKDKTFDYIICRDVLEHSPDVGKALGELNRVGKAGLICVPGAIREIAEARAVHHWLVSLNGPRLVFTAKSLFPGMEDLSMLWRRARQARPLSWQFFQLRMAPFWRIHYEWQDRIDYEVIGEAPNSLQSQVRDITSIAIDGKRLQKLRSWQQGIMYPQQRLVEWWFKRERHRRKVMLADILHCPYCHGNLRQDAVSVICARCSGEFPTTRNMVEMLIRTH